MQQGEVAAEREGAPGAGKKRSHAGRLRRFLPRAAIVLTTLLVLYLVLEFIVFPRMLRLLPPRLYGALPPEIMVLGQSSKKSTEPRDYVAIIGDSWGAGMGDWLLAAWKDWSPRYHVAHILHDKTGRDVVSFGSPGEGMMSAIRRFIEAIDAVNLSGRYRMEAPAAIFVYLYEGNDLNDDLLRHERGVAQGNLRVFEPTAPVGDFGTLDRLYFARFVKNMLTAKRDDRPFSSFAKPSRTHWEVSLTDPSVARQPNVIALGGRTWRLTTHMQGPALELRDDELDLLMAAAEKSLRNVQARFPAAKLRIVHLPSILSTYELVSERVDTERYHNRGGHVPTTARGSSGDNVAAPKGNGPDGDFPARSVRPRSDEIARRIAAVAARLGVEVIDTRPALREVAKREFVHGPIDFTHLNKRGYEVLGELFLPPVQQLDQRRAAGAAH